MGDEPRIDKDVPVPEKNSKGYSRALNQMEVGESFRFPEIDRPAVASLASRLSAKEREYTTRKVNDHTVRIWRVK